MKKVLLVLILLGAPVVAQETYSIGGSAGQVTDLAAVVQATNERTCESWALAITCTQAQSCTAASAVGGSGCSAAQARAAKARLYPATQAGREEFVTFVIVAPVFTAMKADIAKRGQERLCSFWATANQTQKDALCTGSGQSAGCLLCP